MKEIPIGESSGQLILKEGQSILFWSINEDSFLIKGSIDEQVIIRMAENMKKNK